MWLDTRCTLCFSLRLYSQVLQLSACLETGIRGHIPCLHSKDSWGSFSESSHTVGTMVPCPFHPQPSYPTLSDSETPQTHSTSPSPTCAGWTHLNSSKRFCSESFGFQVTETHPLSVCLSPSPLTIQMFRKESETCK